MIKLTNNVSTVTTERKVWGWGGGVGVGGVQRRMNMCRKNKEYKSTWWVNERYIVVNGGMYLNKCPTLMCLATFFFKGRKIQQSNSYDLVRSPSWVFLRIVPLSMPCMVSPDRRTAIQRERGHPVVSTMSVIVKAQQLECPCTVLCFISVSEHNIALI